MKNKIALITGASKRIGSHIAIYLAKQGWDIALHYNSSENEARNTQGQIIQTGQKAVLFKADLTSHEQTNDIFKQINKTFGEVTCLVNSASVFINDKIGQIDQNSWQQNMLVNLYAPVILSQEFVKQLSNDNKGNIINILDYIVWRPPHNFISYTTSKAGLWSITQQLALDLAPKIRVNAIGPGSVLKNHLENDQRFEESYLKSPLKVKTELTEIGNAVDFILNSNSMTGQMIALDSGKHLKGPEIY